MEPIKIKSISKFNNKKPGINCFEGAIVHEGLVKNMDLEVEGEYNLNYLPLSITESELHYLKSKKPIEIINYVIDKMNIAIQEAGDLLSKEPTEEDRLPI